MTIPHRLGSCYSPTCFVLLVKILYILPSKEHLSIAKPEEDMRFKRITIMESYEIIRRWHNRQSIRDISRTLGFDRKTVRKFIKIAKAKGISLATPLPAKDELLALLETSLPKNQRQRSAQQVIQPLLAEIVGLVNDGKTPLKPKTAFEVICIRHDLTGKVSYSSFKRFVRANNSIILPAKSPSSCRLEVPPGNEVQIDYARMGLLFDAITDKSRLVHAFIGTLAFSRHKYVEFVFTQNQSSFIATHVNMFDYFGGVTDRLNLDNLKTGVIKPDLYDPQLNRAYQEMAEHYSCFIDPCRVARPKDKGKVERDVQTIREQFRKLLQLYPELTIQQANQKIKQWCLKEYGQRDHGTTHCKPYPSFVEVEKPALKPLPPEPFEIAQWKQATVHPDHYIQFNKKTFSVPDHACTIGTKVWARGTHKLVQIYYQHKLIKQHVVTACFRHTDLSDFPENVKAALDQGLPLHLQNKAQQIGVNFRQLVRQTLQPHAFINLRKAQGIVSLAQQYPAKLLEQAAGFMLQQKIKATPKNFKRLLETLLQEKQPQQLPLSEQTMEFMRNINYFFNQ
jgi:transposase